MSDRPTVTYSAGMTINLGNYQSARVDIGVSFPVHPDQSNEEVMKAAIAFVKGTLDKELKEIRGEDRDGG